MSRLRDQYGNPEIYVTENGACYDDPVAADGTVHDEDRVAYLRDHLSAARAAIAGGVRLSGYFVWSLLDNFEWTEGFSRRFGMISVDFKTQKRTPKASYQWLADFIGRQNAGRRADCYSGLFRTLLTATRCHLVPVAGGRADGVEHRRAVFAQHLRTEGCAPIWPISRCRLTVADVISGSTPSSRSVSATCSISAARRSPWLAMRSRL